MSATANRRGGRGGGPDGAEEPGEEGLSSAGRERYGHIGLYVSQSRATPGELTVDFVNYNHDLDTDRLTPVTAANFIVRLRTPKLAAAPQVEAIRYDETAPNNTRREPLPPSAIAFRNGTLSLRVPPFGHYQILRLSAPLP